MEIANIFTDKTGPGLYEEAWNYAKSKPFIVTEDEYPWQNGWGICNFFNLNNGTAKVNNYTDLGTGLSDNESKNVGKMISLLNQGILATYMYAGDSLMSYSSGIINQCDSGFINHEVNIVGYGTDNSTNLDYWIVRNSWGTQWGEGGYFRIVRGENMCSIGWRAGLAQV